MRKSEMNPGQLDDRATLVRSLTEAGWVDDAEAQFRADTYLIHEAALALGRQRVYYEATTRSILLVLRADSGDIAPHHRKKLLRQGKIAFHRTAVTAANAVG